MAPLQKTFPLTADVQIPAVGFGTYLIAPDQTAEAVRTAISIGYRHVDTASVYQNEEAVGAGMHAGLRDAGLRREDMFVTTKLWPGAREFGEEIKSYEETIAECDASLTRLGLKDVDLYLIHSPHAGAGRLDQWRAMLEIKRSGKARSVGVSNFSRKHLEEIEAAGLTMPDVNQIELHPWSQKPDLIAYMRERNITPIAYSSLAPLSTWRIEPGQDSAKTDAMREPDAVFQTMAAKYGVSEAQLLLRWGIQNGYAVLPKSLNPERMRQNLDLDGFRIDDADMATIRDMDRGDGLAWSIGDPAHVA